MATIETVRLVLRDSLQIGERADRLAPDTPLLGHVPELDSMAVVTVLTALEETFAIVIADDEVNADTFATLGALVAFVDQKLAA
jgi:acyl carrier protein